MSKFCEICGKSSLKAAKISFSHKQHVHRQLPNLQSVRVRLADGQVKKMNVCTSCIRAGKFTKA